MTNVYFVLLKKLFFYNRDADKRGPQSLLQYFETIKKTEIKTEWNGKYEIQAEDN